MGIYILAYIFIKTAAVTTEKVTTIYYIYIN